MAGILRGLMIAATALTAGVQAGRNIVEQRVEREKQSVIEAAAIEARRRIREQAGALVQSSFRRFVIILAIKLAILSAFVGSFIWLQYPDRWFQIGLILILIAFTIRDWRHNFPVMRFVFVELRKSGWRPRAALAELVAKQVFETVLAEARGTQYSLTSRAALIVAGQGRETLAKDVAEAVAGIARETSWAELRPFVLSAALRFSLMMALYSGAVFLLIRLTG